MQARTPVERADLISRKRAWLIALAAAVFLLVQLVGNPMFSTDPDTLSIPRLVTWAVNAVMLMLLLLTGGGLMQSRQIRSLVNDEVSRSHNRTAVNAGYWMAMATAMILYLIPGFQNFTSRETVYIIVTPSIAVALFAFSYLELRAHRDG